MNKSIKIILSVIIILILAGCRKTVYSESGNFQQDEITISFELEPKINDYNIALKVYYQCSSPREVINAILTAPSGKRYFSSAIIGEFFESNCNDKEAVNFVIREVKNEEGNFTLHVKREGYWNEVKNITMEVRA